MQPFTGTTLSDRQASKGQHQPPPVPQGNL